MEPYFDLSKISGISGYVKYCIDQYDAGSDKTETLKKLEAIFSKDSEYANKVFSGNDFSGAFKERLGEEKLQTLKDFLKKLYFSKDSKVSKHVKKVLENFDLSNVTGIAEYVKYYVDEYYNDLDDDKLLKKMTVIFSKDSKYQIKALKGNDFSAVFIKRVGKGRLRTLKDFLEKIDKDRYSKIDWEHIL